MRQAPKVRDVEEIGREVIAAEIRGLEDLRLSIGAEFRKAVALLLDCRGKTSSAAWANRASSRARSPRP